MSADTSAEVRVQLCRLEDIPDRTARGFLVECPDPGTDGRRNIDIFVHRAGEQVVAYLNSCPHQGTPLEMMPDRFLTRDGKRFLCTTHGAQFRLHDGLCTTGPCKGKHLTALQIEREGADLWLRLPD
jgi:nitrite reductase/ring-hydroxylating ferredoxin subunit